MTGVSCGYSSTPPQCCGNSKTVRRQQGHIIPPYQKKKGLVEGSNLGKHFFDLQRKELTLPAIGETIR